MLVRAGIARLRIMLPALSLPLLLATCGIGSGGSAGAGGGAEVRVVATDFAFAPATITLPMGHPAIFVLENRGGAAHDLKVPDLSIHLKVAPGKTARTNVTAAVAGEWLGMTGTVVVK